MLLSYYYNNIIYNNTCYIIFIIYYYYIIIINTIAHLPINYCLVFLCNINYYIKFIPTSTYLHNNFWRTKIFWYIVICYTYILLYNIYYIIYSYITEYPLYTQNVYNSSWILCACIIRLCRPNTIITTIILFIRALINSSAGHLINEQ